MRLLVLIALAGCGDNTTGTEPCLEVEPAVFTDGPYADPLAIELTDCVEGGLAAIEGRWFLRDVDQLFQFQYPRYRPTCDGGARVADFEDEVVTEEGFDYSFQQWWDGTRSVQRTLQRFSDESFSFEYVTVTAICARADGTLTGSWLEYNDDLGERVGPLIGTRFGRKETALASGLELVGQVSTTSAGEPLVAYNLVVDAGVAYVAGPLGFDVVDVSSPDAPLAIGHLDLGSNDVRVARGDTSVVAYVATNRDETVLVDVADPTAPRIAGAVRGPSDFAISHSLQLAGNRLYVADYSGAVPVFDVSDPLIPTFLGAAQVPDNDGGIHDLTVAGDRLFINQTGSGFVALDLAPGLDQPALLGRTSGTYSHASAVGTISGRSIALHGDEGMTGPDGGAFLKVLDGDLGSAGFLTELGRYQSRPEVGIHNIELAGDRAYVAYYQDGVRIVDLADPAQPREVAFYNTWDPETASSGAFTGAFGLRVVDGLIYVADSERGVLILRETE